MRMELTHLSLFSGIGGLDLAAEWAGFKTIGQCEWAEYPTKVLEKHWPDAPRWKDIRTLTGESFYERTGRRTVDVISGGFPCQPFSVAGKQRGKEDDRYLWPEMVRVIKELRPTWVVGENVAGIVRMALPDILSELEACGYRARTFLIPACAVGARHRRYRVAIVGHAEHNGLSAAEIRRSIGETGKGEQKGKDQTGEFEGAGEPTDDSNVADTKILIERGLSVRAETQKPRFIVGSEDVQHTDSTGREEQYLSGEPDRQGFPGVGCDEGNDASDADNTKAARFRKYSGEIYTKSETEKSGISGSSKWATESELGRMANGLPGWVDGDLDFILNHYWDVEPDIPRIADGVANRVNRLKALGNAVVPQQFYPVFKAIVEVEREREYGEINRKNG